MRRWDCSSSASVSMLKKKKHLFFLFYPVRYQATGGEVAATLRLCERVGVATQVVGGWCLLLVGARLGSVGDGWSGDWVCVSG